MADVDAAATITDVNYVFSSATSLPDSFGEVWTVDPDELRRGSSSLSGPRDIQLAVPLRWQFVVAPPFDTSKVTSAIEAATGPGPRLVRLCPARHEDGFPLASWLLAPLPELCGEADVSILLDYVSSAAMPWTELVDLARRHPGVALVLAGRGANELAVLRACLDAAPNVIVELSRIDDPQWLNSTVSQLGAHRFVFGSGGDPVRSSELIAAAGLGQKEEILVRNGVAASLDAGSWTNEWL